jgi:hypothetical protein
VTLMSTSSTMVVSCSELLQSHDLGGGAGRCGGGVAGDGGLLVAQGGGGGLLEARENGSEYHDVVNLELY